MNVKKTYDFSINDVEKMKTYFNKLNENIPNMKIEFISRSLEYIMQHANNYISDTTNLKNCWVIDVNANYGTLRNTADYSAYVEFGTGIKGTTDSESGYVTNLSGKGESGWTYLKDGNFYFTHGQKARRYLRKAIEEYIRTGSKSIAESVMNKYMEV